MRPDVYIRFEESLYQDPHHISGNSKIPVDNNMMAVFEQPEKMENIYNLMV